MNNDEKDRKDQNKQDNRGFFDGKFQPDRNNGNGGKKSGPDMNPNKNKIALGIFIFLIAMFAMTLFSSRTAGTEVSYSDFIGYVNQGNVKSVNIKADEIIEFTTYENMNYSSRIPYPDSTLLQMLKDNNIQVRGSQQDVSIVAVVLQLIPWVIFIVFAVMLMKQASGNGQLMKYGKSLAKEYSGTDVKITFDDVAGQKEAKYELQEVVDFLKHPRRFTQIGAKIPKGVLLVGPPGTGKTLLAKAVAGEAGVSFFHTSGSDFVEMFVGMGAARVRDLFDQGRKHAPCILFIDELDAVGRQRGSGLGGGHDEREQTLNQMLVEMDGFEGDQGVIVIAATNRPDVLDKALLRAGRFDRQVVVDLPDVKEREDILKIHCKKVKLGSDVDLERIARATPGASGADLANLVNEAALYAARENNSLVSLANFEEARDKMVLGVARKSKVMTVDEKKATAYHEAGHALLYYHLDNTDPLHKVTIIPHGQALGVTMSLPEKDMYTYNKSRLLDQISISMGGYVAEELIYGETTTGTSNDIKQATNLARRMVTEFGMSELGFIALGSEDEPLFLGREIASHKDFSEETAAKIDSQVYKILETAMSKTRKILSDNRNELEKLTEELVNKETLDDNQIRQLLGFEQLSEKNSDLG